MGVYFDERRNKFVVRAKIDGKQTYIGQYDTRAEADYMLLSSTESELSEYKPKFILDDVNVGRRNIFKRFSFFKKNRNA